MGKSSDLDHIKKAMVPAFLENKKLTKRQIAAKLKFFIKVGELNLSSNAKN